MYQVARSLLLTAVLPSNIHCAADLQYGANEFRALAVRVAEYLELALAKMTTMESTKNTMLG